MKELGCVPKPSLSQPCLSALTLCCCGLLVLIFILLLLFICFVIIFLFLIFAFVIIKVYLLVKSDILDRLTMVVSTQNNDFHVSIYNKQPVQVERGPPGITCGDGLTVALAVLYELVAAGSSSTISQSQSRLIPSPSPSDPHAPPSSLPGSASFLGWWVMCTESGGKTECW